jgi:DNA adenine methylase
MAYYHGGKKNIGRDISLIIREISEEMKLNGKWRVQGYCEPFVGMAGVYCHVPSFLGNNINYLAGDFNKNVIDMWKAAQKGWIPPSKCSKSDWLKFKTSPPSPSRTFIGYATDYRGHCFRGFKDSNNVSHQSQCVIECAEKMRDVMFYHSDYTGFTSLENFIIYCDPPYLGTEGYRETFDSEKFWRWCLKMSKNNNIVLVSEYSIPSWMNKHSVLLYSKGKEKLWIVFS